MVTLLKLIVRAVFRLLYRVQVAGLENYNSAGERVLIVCNHTSLLDGVLLYLFLPEPPTFAIDPQIASRWYFRPFLAFVDLFPVDNHNPLSMKSLIRLLKERHKAVIFPEGRITVTGSMMKIYDGPGLVADKSGATILPVGIEGAQFSRLAYRNGLRRVRFPQIRITVLPPRTLDLSADLIGHARRAAAAERLGDIMLEVALANSFRACTLFSSLLDARRRHGPKHLIAEDTRNQRVTYAQLITRSFILGRIMANSAQPGERVGLLLPNSVACLVALMATQCRGLVAAFLNYTNGAQALITACETARIRTVYTSRAFIEAARLQEVVEAVQVSVNVVYLEDLRPRISALDKLRGIVAGRFPRLAYRLAVRAPSPDDTAIILFTSGSEDVPKGVALSHANLLSNRAQVHILIDLRPDDVILNALPMFHSFGFTGSMLLPLLAGTRIFFYPTPLHYRLIPELCYELPATILFGTNTFLAGYGRYAHPYDFFRMRFVVAGGEKLQPEVRTLWANKFGIRIFEGYGTTETGPVISVNTPMHNRNGTVGRLLTGMQAYLEPVEGIEIGGRLVVSGPNVMQGYLFHGSEGELIRPWTDRGPGWYDTGDIVTFDDDGYLRIVGRAKRFAKIGGEMVSLAVVEDLAALAWPQSVSCATCIPDPKKGELIVLVTNQPRPARKDLVEAAHQHGIGELHIPRQIIFTDRPPVMASGKIDYRAVSILVQESIQPSAEASS